MRERQHIETPDYTNAALLVGLVNLVWSFLLIWASFGLPAVLALAVFLNYMITRLAHSRARARAR